MGLEEEKRCVLKRVSKVFFEKKQKQKTKKQLSRELCRTGFLILGTAGIWDWITPGHGGCPG